METKNVTKSRRQKTFGQQERYSYVTKSIFNERLKFKDEVWLRNIDITTEAPQTARKVRRIIEKRMCQTYHKQHKSIFHDCGNKSRHNMKRAISYELYIIGQVENVKHLSRGDSTHWKRQYDPNTGKVVFKKKFGYATIEDAKNSAMKLVKDKPWCHKAVNVYRCAHCNMYHIGHESSQTSSPIISIPALATAFAVKKGSNCLILANSYYFCRKLKYDESTYPHIGPCCGLLFRRQCPTKTCVNGRNIQLSFEWL